MKNHNEEIAQNKFALILLLALLSIFAFAFAVRSQTIAVQLVEVIDGDTVKLKFENNYQFNARLVGIDAPELLQQDGTRCKGVLNDLLTGASLRMYQIARDSYGRPLIKLLRSDYSEINLDLLSSGCAWREGASRRDRPTYEAAEKFARINQLNMWRTLGASVGGVDPISGRVNPCRPKTFRKGKCAEQLP